MRSKKYLAQQFKKATTALLTTFVAISIIGGLFIAFIITTLGVGQGFMGGTLIKELSYPKHKVKLYLYDDSFLDPLTTIKIKHKTWPVMEDLAYIENCQPSELTIWRHDDIVEFTYGDIQVRLFLITRKAQKNYLNKD
jgi:hypothetical protein